MSKNYDNWERLVRAVLRRESDRQFAYIHSCSDSSSISASTTLDLSFRSTAQFDEDDDDDVGIGMSNNYNNVLEKLYRVVLHRELGEMQIAQINPLPLILERIQFSDLITLHHSDWKTMLLPHQQQIVCRSASLIFFPDKLFETCGSNGENCFLVGSKNIEDFNYRHREFKSNPKSRFSEVLEIYDQEDFNVGCRIKTQMLSPNTLYAAYLVFAVNKNYAGVIRLAASTTLKILPYESFYHSKDQDRTVYFELGNCRSDGWMEVELGDFYVYPGEDRELQVGLMMRYDEVAIMNMRRVGLIIEGIEFKPSKDNVLFSKINQFDDDDDDNDDDVGIGMSNNYYNILEKLSRVVLHRELGEMKIAQTSPLPLIEESIQFSDLLTTLHHSDWKTMLLPHQQQIVCRSASLIFFPNTSGSNGENCFLVGSKNIENFNYEHREFNSNTKSRFSEVLEIYDQEDFNVGCRIKTQMLSPNTLYAAYLVFALTEKNARGISLAAISTLEILSYESVSRMVYFETGNGRSDGWMEVKLGDFYVYPGKDREVQVGLMCNEDDADVAMNIRRPRGLDIEGIEFRPSKDYGYFSKFNKSDDDDDDDRASPHTQKVELLTIRTGNNSLMLGARALLISYEDNPWCWKWTTHDHSRFAEVVELKNVWWLKICGKIKTRMLSPKTDYAAFLVFNLTDGCKGLEQAKGMVRFPDNESEYDAEKGAHILNLLIAVSRADGWMEIEMGNFYVDEGNEREVEAQLFEFKSNKSGLIVEGIEFRPV